MQITVTTIIFGLPTGQHTVQTHLTLSVERLRVRELIAQKVQQEIVEYTAQQRPGLSGEYLSPEALIRAEAHSFVPGEARLEVTRAQQAFARRDYMIVIDNRRVFDSDEMLSLRPGSRIEFIKILPLVGG